MSDFDSKARDWDSDPMHWERSSAIAKNLLKMIPVSPNMKALEYGAGTGILSFQLSEYFSEITLMDNSKEMVQVMHEKVFKAKLKHLKPLLFDLEHSDYTALKFDCIFSQMVLHHVANTGQLLNKFYQILNPNGYLAIADLYREDGSFHTEGFTGHKGFDDFKLKSEMESAGFTQVITKHSFTIRKNIEHTVREYPIFLMVATKQ